MYFSNYVCIRTLLLRDVFMRWVYQPQSFNRTHYFNRDFLFPMSLTPGARHGGHHFSREGACKRTAVESLLMQIIRIDLRSNIDFWGESGIFRRYEEERTFAKKGLPCERRLGRVTAELIRALCRKLAPGNRRRNASNCLSSLRCSTGTLPQHIFANIPTHMVVCACNARKYLATPRPISWS